MCSRLVDNMKKHVLRPIVEGGHGGYRCASDLCDKIFTSAFTLKKHARTCTQQKCLAKMERQKEAAKARQERKNAQQRNARKKRTDEEGKAQKELDKQRMRNQRKKSQPVLDDARHTFWEDKPYFKTKSELTPQLFE